MKIVCQSCSAKYSIADDKVQGKKVFKIKCKKCGEDILVRGEGAVDAPGPSGADQFSEDEATRVVSPESNEATWHAVVSGEQQGPFAMAQLRDMMTNGSIDAETYVWKDGFTDWKPMRDVPELFTSLASGMAEAAPPASSGDGGGMFGQAPAAAAMPAASDGGGLFGSSKPAGGGGMFGAASGEAKARAGSKASAGADLFGGESKPMFGGGGGGGGGGGAAAEEEVSSSAGGGSATGARNENSVLFSLASLQQVAGSGSSAKVSEPGAANKSNGDMSGLIDIKSMASSIGGPGSKSKALDDILTVGGGGGLSSPLAAPVLAPIQTPQMSSSEPDRQGGTNKTVVFAAIAVAVIIAGGAVGAAFLMKGNQQPQQQVVMQQAPPAVTPPTTATTATPPVPTQPTPPAAGAAGGTQVAANTETPGGTAPAGGNRERPSSPGGSRGARERPTGSTTASTGSNTGSAANPGGSNSGSTASAGGQTCAQRCHGDIDCLLRCSTQTAPAPRANPGNSGGGGGGGGDGPETPSRNDVISAMNGVRGTVTACGQGMTGTATVAITFASSGRVTTANVSPPFAGTPAGSCIARAVRSASVPSFTRPTFTVNFPFVVH